MTFQDRMMQLRDNSFMRTMTVDPEAAASHPNQTMRQVKSGHFVPVPPKPLPSPELVIYSSEMADELGLTASHCTTDEFVRFFSGDVAAVPGSQTWATPYALSIYGVFRRNQQCPFRNGCGYGDGRAISIQEVVAPSGQRWELQLKGAGTTPFCRGGDGRAVLRSSIREFLASEAMEYLGVATTRALSLIVSKRETTRRPRPEEDEVGSLTESCAITCRVAPSFLRVGHFEVFGRRAASQGGDFPDGTIVEAHSLSQADLNGMRGQVVGRQADRIQVDFGDPHGLKALKPSNLKVVDGGNSALRSLEMLVDHALERECGGVPADSSTAERVNILLKHAVKCVAQTTAQWLRVGFCQGNFNSDNCLISGRTMDYGPFGYVEEFDPQFGSWVGSGSHFAFMNQPEAGLMNLKSLTEALAPLLGRDADEVFESVKSSYLQASEDAKVDVWQNKLGLAEWSSDAAALLSELLHLMKSCGADWTITWRQLAAILALPDDTDDKSLLRPIVDANTHTNQIQARASEWVVWVKKWLTIVDKSRGREVAAKVILASSPKYIPREWMLKEVYDAAQSGDYSGVHELFELFKKPYAEQPEFAKYFVCKPRCSIS
eukprot:TRINITY_DN23925_c0_g1_i1.p1 TRINITY_DN23925_c0_g1~~TRINITY_DN23925_c0_g1_i1.p1  ORF type:complete len:604 (-),score=72.51 TRINITY_DN23925_c0_g1_i1:312-2123(-)